MSADDAEARALLVHDVGKYVSRIARNLPEQGPIAAPLVTMLVKDLYETHQGRRASVRFEELAEALDPSVRDAARSELAIIDGTNREAITIVHRHEAPSIT